MKNAQPPCSPVTTVAVQRRQYAASVTGLYREQLATFFTGEIADELMHALFLANKVAALGRVPTVRPLPVKQPTDARRHVSPVECTVRLSR